MWQNDLIRKLSLISKFKLSKPGKQKLQYTLPNISSKGNQTIKFGQLIEYSMAKVFIENSYTKCGGEISCRSFS